MSELVKLRKIIVKLERKYEKAGPIEQKRIMRKATVIESKIRFITGY